METPATDPGNYLNNRVIQKYPNPNVEKLIRPLVPELYARTNATEFAQVLLSLSVISKSQEDECYTTNNSEKNKYLYDICIRKNSVSKMIVALEKSNNIHILELLCQHLRIQLPTPEPHRAARTEDSRTNETLISPFESTENSTSSRIPQISSQSPRRESRVRQCSLLLRCALIFIILTITYNGRKSSLVPTQDKPSNTAPFNLTSKNLETPAANTSSQHANDNNKESQSTLKAELILSSQGEVTVPQIVEFYPNRNIADQISYNNKGSAEHATPTADKKKHSPLKELPRMDNPETSTNRPTLLAVLTQSTLRTTENQLHSGTRLPPSYNYEGEYPVSPFVNINNPEKSPYNVTLLSGLEQSSTDETVTIETNDNLTTTTEMSTPKKYQVISQSRKVKSMTATTSKGYIEFLLGLDPINNTEKPVTIVVTVPHKKASLDYYSVGFVSITITSPNGLLARELTFPVVNLTIRCEKKYDWRSRPWPTHNGSNILILTLVGCFNQKDFQYFLNNMKNIHTFRMFNDFCMCDEFETEPALSPSKPLLINENVHEIYISTVGGECDFLFKALSRFHFPNLKRITFDHPYIVATNKEYFEGFVLRNQYNLKNLQLIEAVLCTTCDLFYNNKKCFFHQLEMADMYFSGSASSFRSSVKTVISLSFSSPNLNLISTNLLCEGMDIRLLLENWKTLDRDKSQLCVTGGEVNTPSR